MTFEELLAQFRVLGGVAENVRLGVGERGRGVFVIDPSKPAKLHASENLLVPVDDLDLRDGELVVKATSRVGARERALFETLQNAFGWSAGGRDEVWKSQIGWSQVPPVVVERIQTMGMRRDLSERFLPPTQEICARRYVGEREVSYRDGAYLMPVVDLVNHASAVNTYDFRDGVGVSGSFEGEVLVRYNTGDSWSRALGYGFAERALHAHSLGIELDIFEQRISIGRRMKESEVREGIAYPRTHIAGSAISLSYLTLGLSPSPTLPRAIFREVVSPNLSPERADEAFDNVAHFNRMTFLRLLRELGSIDGEVPGMLRAAIIAQLETLSHCIGARLRSGD